MPPASLRIAGPHEERTKGCCRTPPRELPDQNGISSSRSSATEGFGSDAFGGAANVLSACSAPFDLAALVGWPLPVVACFGGGMRTRRAPTTFPPKSVWVG